MTTETRLDVKGDDGVGTLLMALNTISGLDVVECRERDAQDIAYVLFRYGHSSRELGAFVAELGPRLRAVAPDIRFVIVLELVAGGREVLARLSLPSRAADRLAGAVRTVSPRYVVSAP